MNIHLQGAKGLLVNITGGSDIKLFEVDAAVNKIRAEVDPEAEFIFGAIKDENMNGKIRVSIVATALKGSRDKTPEPIPVLNVVIILIGYTIILKIYSPKIILKKMF